MWSKAAFIIAVLVIAFFALEYYPKWKKPRAEATIGWDVSGYYAYLPAFFIYNDIHKAAFLDSMQAKYEFSPAGLPGFYSKTGNFIMKYSMGQAMQFLPWFTLAHLTAGTMGYPADGYSLPYQAAISWGSLLVAILGLWISRRNLLTYFSDKATALSLLLLVLGINYLNYAAIDNAMTHNWLFTCLSLLVFSTIRYYQKPGFGWAASAGFLLGWAVITRPTEIVAVVLPIFWGVGSFKDLRERLNWIRSHIRHYALAGFVCLAVGFMQLAYWKIVGGEWLIYSYEDQGFDWLKPHVIDVLFSARAGWLAYSPMLVFAIAGLYFLFRQQPKLFPTILLFLTVTFYVVSAWHIWWYGGSLGMRALVQSYALGLFPLAAFCQWLIQRRFRFWIFLPVALFFSAYNIYWTIQAHKSDGVFVSEQMTGAYFWKVAGRWSPRREWLVLLDSKEGLSNEDFFNAEIIYKNNFETDSSAVTTDKPLEGTKSLFLGKDQQFSPDFRLPLDGRTSGIIRTRLLFAADPKEWDWWRMAQAIVRFKKDGKEVKTNMIRLQRHADGSEQRQVYFDTKLPKLPFDEAFLYFWNAESEKNIRIDDVTVHYLPE